MANAWSGDGAYVLPARKIEPYRLWFEFLKFALKDPDIKVDKRIYKSWGNVEDQTFNEWWPKKWRELFAVDAGVRLLDKREVLQDDDAAIALRIPISLNETAIIQEVRKIIRKHGVSSRGAKRVAGRFSLTESSKQGFEKHLRTARLMLRLYGYWLKHHKLENSKRINHAITDYYDWAMAWEQKIKDKPRGYRGSWQPYLFDSLELYVDWLRAEKRERQTAFGAGDFNTETLSGEIEGTNAENARRVVVKQIRKARRIAENVAKGQFPGKY
jgi:hypothetical protein